MAVPRVAFPHAMKRVYDYIDTLIGATPATVTTAGVVKEMAHIAPLVAAPTQADFNGLLTALIAAGHMSAT